MATGWFKSLQCKSKAFDDVVHHHCRRRPNPNNHHHHHHHHHSLSQSSSCKNRVQALKDVVESTGQPKPKNPKPPKPAQTAPFRRPVSTKPDTDPRDHPPATRSRSSSSESFFPSLTELPEGHPSRNVVEIIFHTSWGEKSFSGRIEMVFKVQNLSRTVTRFEEYREMVKSRESSADPSEGAEDHARCVADGNEVMRFYGLGATSGGGAYDVSRGAWALYGGKGAAVCTYSGSGGAHESGGGGGRGRRAMLVCRVIAGRVSRVLDNRFGYDSVSGENDELLVFDSRAVLPCFLIIYIL